MAPSRKFCGFLPLKTVVYLITIFGILNKLSGLYGIISFDFTDKAATALHFYGLVAIVSFSYAFYGLYTDNVRTIRWYTMIFWLDCLVNMIFTAWFAVVWFVYTDHSVPELADDPEKLAEHDRVFQLERQVSIAVLVVLRLLQFYFAYIVTCYYKIVKSKANYSKVASDDIDLEETTTNNNRSKEPYIKPAQD